MQRLRSRSVGLVFSSAGGSACRQLSGSAEVPGKDREEEGLKETIIASRRSAVPGKESLN